MEIVGVAKTSKYTFIIETPREFLYLPYRQRPPQSMFLLAESLAIRASLVTPLREVVRSLDANLPISNIRSMEELYRMRSVDVLDVTTTIIGAMGMMGLALAIVGLYGLVAYAVSRRTREIGIRMAIGAGRSDVLRMVLRQGMGLASPGSASVCWRAPALPAPGRDLSRRSGPATAGRTLAAFPLVAATVLAVTLLAAYLPARRASLINPTDALRAE